LIVVLANEQTTTAAETSEHMASSDAAAALASISQQPLDGSAIVSMADVTPSSLIDPTINIPEQIPATLLQGQEPQREEPMDTSATEPLLQPPAELLQPAAQPKMEPMDTTASTSSDPITTPTSTAVDTLLNAVTGLTQGTSAASISTMESSGLDAMSAAAAESGEKNVKMIG